MEKDAWRRGGIPKQAKAIITGASTGIGRALALDFAREFQGCMILNARGAEELEKTAAAVRQAGGQATCVVGDVADAHLAKRLVDTCVSEYGGVDILVNNAGLARSGPMTALTMADWRYVFEVNFFAALNLSYAVLPMFMEHAHGKIVNIASVAGKVAFPGSVCYSSSKFALTGLSEGMAAEFAGKVDVLTVCPGWVRTDFFKRNNTADDPSAIANEPGMRGWLMKNILSISSEQASRDIIRALYRGGSQELVLTLPGYMVERLSGFFPELTFFLSSLVPADRRRKS